MDANKILQADALDLLFEGRNKEYGAYELRTNYRKRLLMAVGSMIALCGCMVILNAFAVKPKAAVTIITFHDTTILNPFDDEPKPPPPVEQPKTTPVQVETIKIGPPKIVNEDIKPEDEIPEADKIEDIKIGLANTPGEKDPGIVSPPFSQEGTGVIEAPKPKEKEDSIFVSVQIPAEYPGGMQAWLRYLNKTLPKYYTGELIDRELQGRVVVQFIVDKEGNVSDVQGVEGPKELREAAEKVISLSGRWTPAVQNGHKVKAYKKQPIVFQLQQE